tara:strand:- start:3157 stop:3660 length:504 start_codon:yes stop_codon:yes gene_type:complete
MKEKGVLIVAMSLLMFSFVASSFSTTGAYYLTVHEKECLAGTSGAPYDVNGDGKEGSGDVRALKLIIDSYGYSPSSAAEKRPCADVNNDGLVDEIDLTLAISFVKLKSVDRARGLGYCTPGDERYRAYVLERCDMFGEWETAEKFYSQQDRNAFRFSAGRLTNQFLG